MSGNCREEGNGRVVMSAHLKPTLASSKVIPWKNGLMPAVHVMGLAFACPLREEESTAWSLL